MNDTVTLNIGNRPVPNASCCDDASALCPQCGEEALKRMVHNVPTGGILVGETGIAVGHDRINGHTHKVQVDTNGFGLALEADGHVHKIENFNVVVSTGHNHSLLEISLKSSLEAQNAATSTYDDPPLRPAGGDLLTSDETWQEAFEREAGMRSQSDEIVLNVPQSGGPSGGGIPPIVWEFD